MAVPRPTPEQFKYIYDSFSYKLKNPSATKYGQLTYDQIFQIARLYLPQYYNRAAGEDNQLFAQLVAENQIKDKNLADLLVPVEEQQKENKKKRILKKTKKKQMIVMKT